MPRFIFSLVAILVAQFVHASAPEWHVFDADYPEDAIDRQSVAFQSKTIVRFWERAGIEHLEKDGQRTYPAYTLTEIDCKKKTYRDLKWDSALEAQGTPAGMAARAQFLEATREIQGKYPSPWASIDPDKHSYARFDLVCAKWSPK